ncbi:major capsid protein [Bacillus sp. AFS017336]|uniref:major capsid protein n=1 Tax=Bacillus sp. AFS017336 TaxID=2033489 RepID=UPI000BF1C960|nr:major capsid protein [Bacillus sp. AFS017336]PEL12675.1 coat protein [Bacillus sp. AFS017336]
MAFTKISDVIVPQVFNPYVLNRTTELSEIYQSGIVQREQQFDDLAASSARTINMPYWNDLSGASESLSDSGALTPDKITAGQDIAVILRRGKAWSSNDLAANLAGSDPMKAIGDLVAGFWARDMQKTVLSLLKGIFASASMSNNVSDISALTGGAEKIGGSSFIDASYRLGDAQSTLSAVVMHSAVVAALAKQNLIQYLKPSEGSPEVPYYLGKRVIVDDSTPNSSGVYTTYLFGQGAVALGFGSPVGFVETETDRDSLAGNDYLINRKTMILHPRGVAFQSASVGGAAPTNTELETATNWNRVYDPKKIRVVKFVHKI